MSEVEIELVVVLEKQFLEIMVRGIVWETRKLSSHGIGDEEDINSGELSFQIAMNARSFLLRMVIEV